MQNDDIIVIGGGQAAGELAHSLRREGHAGGITVVTEEPLPPYQRPNLSKRYLQGLLAPEKLLYRPASFYVENAVGTRLDTRVDRIDRAQHLLHLADGGTLRYGKLALCTGARVRPLQVPGAELPGVHYLRSLADTHRLRDALAGARRVLCIGGGFLCMEAAGAMRAMGKDVTVLEMYPHIMANAAAPEVSAFFEEIHRQRGVDVRTHTRVAAIEPAERGLVVVATGGEVFHADIVLVGIGIRPCTELAEAAGLPCDDGIVVDEDARTADPDIVAAGDCTRHPNALLGRALRLESVHNAVQQAKTAAATLCGRSKPYAQAPWVWSDQQGFRIQMVGLAQAGDERVVRGNPAAQSFSVWYFRAGRLVACHAVNRPADYMACRRLLEHGLSPAPTDIAQPRFDPYRLLPRKAPLAFQRRAAIA